MTFSKPFRALLWKEWRESWWLLAAAVVAPVGWCALVQLFRAVSDTQHGELWQILAPTVSFAIALSLGARLFAGERANGTASFQTERPVTRGMVWNAKLLLPAPALLVGEALLVFSFVRLWPIAGWDDRAVLFLLCTPLILSFTSAVLCSVLLDRPVTAWAGGAVLSIGLWAGPVILLKHLGVDMDVDHPGYGMALLLVIQLGVEAVALLWLSRIAYVRWLKD